MSVAVLDAGEDLGRHDGDASDCSAQVRFFSPLVFFFSSHRVGADLISTFSNYACDREWEKRNGATQRWAPRQEEKQEQ